MNNNNFLHVIPNSLEALEDENFISLHKDFGNTASSFLKNIHPPDAIKKRLQVIGIDTLLIPTKRSQKILHFTDAFLQLLYMLKS